MANGTSFGSRLAEARKAAELTQEELGVVLGVGKGAVSSWEVDRTQPSVSQLALLSERLKVSADRLLGRDKPRSPANHPSQRSGDKVQAN